ncbi:hypothetical protein PENSUB_10668 [Penicillium subrubescens]|uniref:Uncharacterized protein n=1 Tax=Penicillium subrubescens TaxID=1316194 RepID=A0A1Q5T8C8_9EURO|nr:hypothetical protein PENSUB_10668 [Penicillium subrubescens]
MNQCNAWYAYARRLIICTFILLEFEEDRKRMRLENSRSIPSGSLDTLDLSGIWTAGVIINAFFGHDLRQVKFVGLSPGSVSLISNIEAGYDLRPRSRYASYAHASHIQIVVDST